VRGGQGRVGEVRVVSYDMDVFRRGVRFSARGLAVLLVCVASPARPAGAQERGVAVVQRPTHTGVRRALVVGISRYLYLPADKQLNYADSDAAAFARVLRTRAGGALPDSNIRRLLNEDATAGRITTDLGWLVQASQPGDEAIIYFAGHGDVEKITGLQGGFLLATDAPSNNYFAGGALQVSVLGQFIAGITQKGGTVLLVTDACRSGKLIDPEGARHTTAALLEAWNGVVKLVSSSPDQSSYEGAQWGGGHGVFTYYLIAGLEGLAASDGDSAVTLDELWRYVKDNVKRETENKQSPPAPMADMDRQIAVIDTGTLRSARAMLAHHQPVQLAARSAAGDSTPGDTAVLHALEAFRSALGAGALVEPAGVSAWDRYHRLARLRGAGHLLDGVRGSLAAAFQDDAQRVIVDYLAGGNTQPAPARLRRAALELGRARVLLGPKDVLASSLLAHQLFFAGYANVRTGNYRAAVDSLQRSVALEPNAAYAYNALGFAYLGLSRYADARRAFDDAQRRSPGWSYPAQGLALVAERLGQRREAETGFKQAIQEDSTYLEPRVELASLYLESERPADAERMLRDVLARDSSDAKTRAKLAGLLQAEGRVADAEREYRRVAALDTSNFAPLNDLGALLLNHTERYAEAEATLRQAERLAPQAPLVAANLGLVYQRLGRPAEAEREYRRAIGLDSLNPDRYEALGVFYFNETRVREAETAFKRAAALAPQSARLAGELGWTYRMEQRGREAEREYRRAIALDSLSADRYNDLGVVLFDASRFADAQVAFARAAALDPASAMFNGNLGLADLKVGRPADAARVYERAAALDSLNFRRYNDVGVAAFELGRYATALAAFVRAQALNPQSADVADNLGLVYRKLGQAVEAEHAYQRAITLDSLNFARPNQLGQLLLENKRYGEAETLFLRAARLAPQASDSADVSDNLGLTYRALNEPGKAAREFRRAIALDPTGSLWHFHLGQLLADSSRYGEAAAELRRAAALAPQSADVAGTLAWVYAKTDTLGQPDAQREYRRAMALDSSNFHWPNALGLLLLHDGRYAEAEALFRRGLRLAPAAADSADVRDNLGVALQKLNQPVAAAREFDLAVTLDSLGRLHPAQSAPEESHDREAARDLGRGAARAPRGAHGAGEEAWVSAKLGRAADAARGAKPMRGLFQSKPAAGQGMGVPQGDRARLAELLPGALPAAPPPPSAPPPH